MNGRIYDRLPQLWPDSSWLRELAQRGEEQLQNHPHGDLPRWRRALEQLPACEPTAEPARSAPRLGGAVADPQRLKALLMELHPWRKGPLEVGGLYIDSEWRSDWKWDRVAPHVNLSGSRVLDIGSGNGYYGLRMLGAGADLVIGIDPTVLFVMQWLAWRHFAGDLPCYVLPLGVEDLPAAAAGLDAVFSMGVLYHRRDPAHHLERIRGLLRPGGTLVLETLVLPKGKSLDLLVPEERYARMRNVWAVPGIDRLREWVKGARFKKIEVVDVSATTTSEQRSTEWMRFESLEQALEAGEQNHTVEGYPAPVRATLVAVS